MWNFYFVCIEEIVDLVDYVWTVSEHPPKKVSLQSYFTTYHLSGVNPEQYLGSMLVESGPRGKTVPERCGMECLTPSAKLQKEMQGESLS